MRFQILSIFPELFTDFCRLGLVGRACTDGRISIDAHQLREHAINTHGQIDDSPFGGGSGMVLRPDAAIAALEAGKARAPGAKVILFSPRGKRFDQAKARAFARWGETNPDGLIFLCCRYEGVDERVIEHWVDEELSLGDYILQGGEVAAMAVIEAVSRLVPGVLGNPDSTIEESFENGLLEHPQYTKPSEFRGYKVPDVLLSGNHAEIARWRSKKSREVTANRRPDLLERQELPTCELNIALIHHPVLNKNGDVVVSSITNMDISDIARSARTFGIGRYYIVHPTKTLRRLTEKICSHWETGYGSTYNPNRSDALRRIVLVPDIDDMLTDIETRTGQQPLIITTSAKRSERSRSFFELRSEIYRSDKPHVIMFGTGWGLTDDLLARAHFHLEPIEGFSDYNHLSVRGAAAIIFDRLFGKHEES